MTHLFPVVRYSLALHVRHSPAALHVVQSEGHFSQSIFFTTKSDCLQDAQPVLSLQVWQPEGHVTHLFPVVRYSLALHVRHSPAALHVVQSEGQMEHLLLTSSAK